MAGATEAFVRLRGKIPSTPSGRALVLWDYRLSSTLSLYLSIYIFKITSLTSQSFNIDVQGF